MCGVIGWFAKNRRVEDISSLRAGLQEMRHRGPDGEGILKRETPHGSLHLGHRRLAIIDLSPAGNQPMVSSDGRYAMTFNGEIYNYIEIRKELQQKGHNFHTQTDSEVLLSAWSEWGEGCLDRLDGMYAFVIHDMKSNFLHCVVDPFGIKPLFFINDDNDFMFASEVPALLKLRGRPSSLDWERSVSFLLWGRHDVGEGTFIREIRRLRPGYILSLSLDDPFEISEKRWWRWETEKESKVSFSDAAEELRDVFLNSIKRQLRSDVPIGFSLSGGVDSSSIVCAVRHIDRDYPINTFSYIASSDVLSERKWAEVVNDHVNARPHWIHDHSDEFDLDAAIYSQGEPFGSTSILAGFHVFRRMKAEGVVVSLEGQGADEALAGYDGYPQAVVRELFSRGRPLEAVRFLRAWSQWPGRGRKALVRLLGDMTVPLSLRRHAVRLAGYDPTPSWLNTDRLAEADVSLDVPLLADARAHSLRERLRIALTEDGLPRLLRYGDRNSMALSIEARVPFLSPPLIRFLQSMPTHYLVSPNGETKHLFRAAMRGIVPDAILDRKDKIGYETPEFDLLRANRAKIDAWLEEVDGIPFLNLDEVRKTVGNYLDGTIPYQTRCWRLVNFCRWYMRMQPMLE